MWNNLISALCNIYSFYWLCSSKSPDSKLFYQTHSFPYQPNFTKIHILSGRFPVSSDTNSNHPDWCRWIYHILLTPQLHLSRIHPWVPPDLHVDIFTSTQNILQGYQGPTKSTCNRPAQNTASMKPATDWLGGSSSATIIQESLLGLIFIWKLPSQLNTVWNQDLPDLGNPGNRYGLEKLFFTASVSLSSLPTPISLHTKQVLCQCQTRLTGETQTEIRH